MGDKVYLKVGTNCHTHNYEGPWRVDRISWSWASNENQYEARIPGEDDPQEAVIFCENCYNEFDYLKEHEKQDAGGEGETRD